MTDTLFLGKTPQETYQLLVTDYDALQPLTQRLLEPDVLNDIALWASRRINDGDVAITKLMFAATTHMANIEKSVGVSTQVHKQEPLYRLFDKESIDFYVAKSHLWLDMFSISYILNRIDEIDAQTHYTNFTNLIRNHYEDVTYEIYTPEVAAQLELPPFSELHFTKFLNDIQEFRSQPTLDYRLCCMIELIEENNSSLQSATANKVFLIAIINTVCRPIKNYTVDNDYKTQVLEWLVYGDDQQLIDIILAAPDYIYLDTDNFADYLISITETNTVPDHAPATITLPAHTVAGILDVFSLLLKQQLAQQVEDAVHTKDTAEPVNAITTLLSDLEHYNKQLPIDTDLDDPNAQQHRATWDEKEEWINWQKKLKESDIHLTPNVRVVDEDI